MTMNKRWHSRGKIDITSFYLLNGESWWNGFKKKRQRNKRKKKKRGKENKLGTTAGFGTKFTVLKAEEVMGNKPLIFLCMLLRSQEGGPFAAQEIGNNLCMYLFAVLPFSFSRSRCTQPAGDWVR